MNVIRGGPKFIVTHLVKGFRRRVLLRQEVVWVHEKLWRNGSGKVAAGQRRKTMRL